MIIYKHHGVYKLAVDPKWKFDAVVPTYRNGYSRRPSKTRGRVEHGPCINLRLDDPGEVYREVSENNLKDLELLQKGYDEAYDAYRAADKALRLVFEKVFEVSRPLTREEIVELK